MEAHTLTPPSEQDSSDFISEHSASAPTSLNTRDLDYRSPEGQTSRSSINQGEQPHYREYRDGSERSLLGDSLIVFGKLEEEYSPTNIRRDVANVIRGDAQKAIEEAVTGGSEDSPKHLDKELGSMLIDAIGAMRATHTEAPEDIVNGLKSVIETLREENRFGTYSPTDTAARESAALNIQYADTLESALRGYESSNRDPREYLEKLNGPPNGSEAKYPRRLHPGAIGKRALQESTINELGGLFSKL